MTPCSLHLNTDRLSSPPPLFLSLPAPASPPARQPGIRTPGNAPRPFVKSVANHFRLLLHRTARARSPLEAFLYDRRTFLTVSPLYRQIVRLRFSRRLRRVSITARETRNTHFEISVTRAACVPFPPPSSSPLPCNCPPSSRNLQLVR